MPDIFVCYRRDDSAGYAGRLYDHLSAELGDPHVFMDVDAIPPGEDFRKVLEERVGRCDVLLAIIGRRWVPKLRDAATDDSDYVRIEIETALNLGIKVIPVLVDGADMPQPSDLPATLQPLAFRQAVDLRQGTFQADVGRLIERLDVHRLIPPPSRWRRAFLWYRQRGTLSWVSWALFQMVIAFDVLMLIALPNDQLTKNGLDGLSELWRGMVGLAIIFVPLTLGLRWSTVLLTRRFGRLFPA